ncbi:acyl-CoA dehydrogenase family protein [Desulfobacterales bacterium HSG2]|nr:acyl-CoA dehydrogenase family protein [Desulfobacterales bacterium HSG2]
MRTELTPEQSEQQEAFRAFADEKISPEADQYDRDERIPAETLKRLAEKGYSGATIPKENGGSGMDMITYGLLCEEIGRGSASLLSLITIQTMVSQAILKWGDDSQKAQWLPKMGKGEILCSFALTEPEIGSDAKNVGTSAVLSDGTYLLNGRKKWISGGQIADLFLIIAQCDGAPAAFLVERDTPGFFTEPIGDMMGFRSAMLAEIRMEDCRIPEENLLGRIGFGFSHVAGTSLDFGRYSVAWGCVGLARACLEASLDYTEKRKQFGVYLKEHQLIQGMIADMITNLKAARMLCIHAGHLKDSGDPSVIMETSVAKYFASRIAVKAAMDAVQIHGANGCSSQYPVQRYMRDAKVMEIIEGSNQIQQTLIAKYGYLIKD